MMSGSQNRLKGKLYRRQRVRPPSWKSTTPIRRVRIAIPPLSLAHAEECYSKSVGRVNEEFPSVVDRFEEIAPIRSHPEGLLVPKDLTCITWFSGLGAHPLRARCFASSA